MSEPNEHIKRKRDLVLSQISKKYRDSIDKKYTKEEIVFNKEVNALFKIKNNDEK